MELTLAENGIFLTAKDIGYRCYLCDADFWNADYHRMSSKHRAIVERFGMIFHGHSNSLECKICAKDLDWRDLGEHARLHALTPWYTADCVAALRPKLSPELDKYYCERCDESYEDLFGAIAHWDGQTHAEQVPSGIYRSGETGMDAQDSTERSDVALLDSPESTRPSDVPRLDCPDFTEHRHVTRLDAPVLAESLCITGPDNYICEESQPEIVYGPVRLPQDHIVQLGGNVRCHICDWTIVPGATDDHVRGTRHAKSIERFYKHVRANGECYRCEACNYKFYGSRKLYYHLNTQGHLAAVEKCECVESETSEPIARIEKDFHPQTLSESNTRCQICRLDIPLDQAEAHGSSDQHELALQNFRAFVTRLKDDKYCCEACRCTIRGLDNVYLHLHGTKHRGVASRESPRHAYAASDATETIANLNLMENSHSGQKTG